MDAPALDATRFIQPALLSIFMYLLIVVISSMKMVKPANVSGSPVLGTTLSGIGEFFLFQLFQLQ
jgi:hypothetical protein